MKKKILIITPILLCIIIAIIFIVNNGFSNKVEANFPDDSEPYKKTTTLKDNWGGKEDVELKYDQYVVASGYMGASDNVYYTRNHGLYHLKVSTNEVVQLAEGVDTIKGDKEKVIVKKGKDFKMIKEDGYIEYVD